MWRNAGGREERFGVALDLLDLDLRDALAEALDAHPALAHVAPDAAPDVLVTDRGAPGGAEGPLRLRIGSPGPLPAQAGPELILSAAHLIAAGLRLVPAEPARDAYSTPVQPRLSPREREVLALLVDGAPNKSIARALGISVRTAKFHVAAVLAKLGARNRAGAVSLALREGLIVL